MPLAYMGVVAALLAILGAFGFLSLIGSRFVNLSSVMPFLVLGNSIYLLTYLHTYLLKIPELTTCNHFYRAMQYLRSAVLLSYVIRLSVCLSVHP